MDNNSEIQQINGWTVRLRVPEGTGPHPVLLMVHGLAGDQDSMWVFTGRLPQEALIIAPRAPHTTARGGFTWDPERDQGFSNVEAFRPALQDLLGLLDNQYFPQADFSRMSVAGFSQGAALSYTFALLYPERVRALAGLAGFMPEGAEALIESRPLEGKPAFVAHGTRDETVTVDRAREAVELLEQAGAQVTYCEDDVGHKLSASCFRGLGSFFRENF